MIDNIMNGLSEQPWKGWRVVGIAYRQVDKQSCRSNPKVFSHLQRFWVIRMARLSVRTLSIWRTDGT